MPGGTIACQHLLQDGLQLPQGDAMAVTGLDDEIGALAFLGIRHLQGLDLGEARRCHARPGKDPGMLQEAWRGHHDDGVAAPLASGFEEQRDIEHDQLSPARALATDEALSLGLDQRMQNLFQPFQLCRVAEDLGPQRWPVNAAGDD